MLVLRLLLGFGIGVLSALGVVLVLCNVVAIPSSYFTVLVVALVLWLIEFGYAVYVGASHEDTKWPKRIKDTVIGIVLAPVSSAATMLVFFIVLFKGDPKKFEVIAKVQPKAATATS